MWNLMEYCPCSVRRRSALSTKRREPMRSESPAQRHVAGPRPVPTVRAVLPWLRWTPGNVATRSADKLIEGVLVGGGSPQFHHLAVAQMEDLRLFDLDAPPAAACREDRQSHAVLVVGEDRVKVSAEGSVRELHELAEEPEDRLPPAVLT